MITLHQAIGKNSPNWLEDVRQIHKRLMEIGKIPSYEFTGKMDDTIQNGIIEVQKHFMRNPDGVINVGGRTLEFINNWKIKPIDTQVKFIGRLKEAWVLVNPLLPDESYCASGYRSAADQRRILHDFFQNKYRDKIINKYGQKVYDQIKRDLLKNENKVLEMVRGVGQQIAAPGSSKHQIGKAIDIGGPSNIDKKQVDIVKLVAKAHPDLFSGKVLLERNGCVHFEII